MAWYGAIWRDMAKLKNAIFFASSVPAKTCAILLPKTGTTMKDPEQKKRFILLRAEGWSLTHIAREMKISRNTLMRWGNEFRRPIEKLHQAELEALAEKLIKRPEDRARALAAKLQEVE